MLVDGVHGNQCNLVVTGGLDITGGCSGRGSFQDRDTSIGNGAAQILALQGGNGSLHAFVAHDIGVLGHGGQDVTVVDQAQDGIGLIKAHADNIHTGCLHSVASTIGGAFVATEDAHNPLGDVVLGNALGLGGVAFAVLGLQQLEAGALEGGAEAVFTGHTGGGGGVDVDDADLTGSDTLLGQGIQHGLTGSLTGGGVVGGEGGLTGDVGGRVHIDDLHTGGFRFLQGGRDGVGAVGGHDDGLVAGRDGVVDLLDLQGVVLGVGSHEGQLHTQLGGGLLSAFLQGNPVLIDGVHGNQCDLVGFAGVCSSGLFAAGAACHQAQNHSQTQQNRECLFHYCSS